jgi:dTDP-4-amino-4,6-dideoxygalactose transaminase
VGDEVIIVSHTFCGKSAARTYDEILANVEGIGLPWRRSFESHVYHLYVITYDRRDELLKYLARLGVSTGLHYPTPVHLQPCYKWLGLGPSSLPVTEMAARRVLSLPMFPEVKPEQVEYVCSLIKDL